MKNFTNKKTAFLASAGLVMAALVQACGASSGGSSSGAVVASSSVVNTLGPTATSLNVALYEAASSYAAAQLNLAQLGITYITINNAYSETSPDGTGGVTNVTFTDNAGSYQGSLVPMGPSVGYSGGIITNILLNPYDSVTINASGTWSGSSIFNCNNGNSISGGLYGVAVLQGSAVQGSMPFQITNTPIGIPANGGGFLYVGMNSSSTQDYMCFTLSATITRCVDSSGNTHPC